MNQKILTEITGFADVNGAAMKDVDELALQGNAIGQFSKLVGGLSEPAFSDDGQPILNRKKKQVYRDVRPEDIEELKFTRDGAGRLGYCAGWKLDYVRRSV